MAWSKFQRRLRTASRVALYGSLALSLTLLAIFVSILQRPLVPDPSVALINQDFESFYEVQLLRDYARIDTTPDSGDEIAGANFLARLLTEAGIPYELEIVGPRQANLWAVLEGEDPQALVLLSHLDVEPIRRPEDWRYPPFEAKIEPPWIFGRGVFDMKSVTIAQLLAFIDLKESGRPLERSVIFLATSSEETGSDLGIRRLLRERPELVDRFWGVLTEGGWLEARNLESLKFWGVEFGQKRYVDLYLCHQRREPLDDLTEILREEGYGSTDLELTDEVRAFLATYAATRDREDYRRWLGAPDRLLRDPATFEQVPAYLQSLFRNELVPIRVEKQDGGGYRLALKYHLLPRADFAAVKAKLLPEWKTHGLEILEPEPEPPHTASPIDHPLFLEATEILRREAPGAVVGPLFLPWTATDARFLRAAGIPTYGFSPFLILTTDTLFVSTANERLSLPGYLGGVRIYRDLVQRVATADH